MLDVVHHRSRCVIAHYMHSGLCYLQVLGWSKDPKAVRALCWDLAEMYGAALMAQTQPTTPGLRGETHL